MKTRFITASLFVMLYLENFSRFAPQPGNEPRGYNSTSQHGGARRGSAGGGACDSPAPSPGREGFRFRRWREQPRSGPCGWRPSRVCLLLRRRHIVCVRSGERGRGRCRFPPQVQGEPPGEAVEGGSGAQNRAAGARPPLVLPADSGVPFACPCPPSTHTHQPRRLQPTGEARVHPQPGAGGGLGGLRCGEQRLM